MPTELGGTHDRNRLSIPLNDDFPAFRTRVITQAKSLAASASEM